MTYSVLIRVPSNLTPYAARQAVLEAMGGVQDSQRIWQDSAEVSIPASGRASGTRINTGRQIIQFITTYDFAETQRRIKPQWGILAFQAFDGSSVDMPISTGTLAHLNGRGSQVKNVNWFPVYQGQADWTAA